MSRKAAEGRDYGCIINISKSTFRKSLRFAVSLLPRGDIQFSVYDDEDVTNLNTKVQARFEQINAESKKMPTTLANRESVEIRLHDKYKQDPNDILKKLLDLMPRVHHVQLFHTESGKNVEGVLSVLNRLKNIDSVQLSYYQGAVLEPSAVYLNAITWLGLINTKPMYVANFRNQLKSIYVRLEIPHPDAPVIGFDVRDYYTYGQLLLQNAITLEQVDIYTTHPMVFQYFSLILNVLNGPHMDRMHLSYDEIGNGPDVHYTITRDDDRELYRTLVSSSMKRMAMVFDDEVQARANYKPIDVLNTVAVDNEDAVKLVALVRRHRNDLRRLTVELLDNWEMGAQIMNALKPLFDDHLEAFRLHKNNDRPSYTIILEADKERSGLKLMADLPNDRPVALFERHVTYVSLVIRDGAAINMAAGDHVAETKFYTDWLMRLDDVVLLAIKDERHVLFEAAVTAVATREKRGLKTWPQLENIIATLPNEYEHLEWFIKRERAIGRGLKTILFHVRKEEMISGVRAWFVRAGWPEAVVQSNGVMISVEVAA